MHVVWHGVSSVAFLYMYQPSVKSTHPSDGYWHGPARIEGKLPNRLPKPRNNDPKLSLLVGSEVAGCESTTALGSTITVRTSIFRNCIIISGLSVVIPVLYVPYDYFDTLFNSVTAIFPQSTHTYTTCFSFKLSRLHSKQSGVVKGVIPVSRMNNRMCGEDEVITGSAIITTYKRGLHFQGPVLVFMVVSVPYWLSLKYKIDK